MDIKERIDNLTEAEAKAALVEVLNEINSNKPCREAYKGYCNHWDVCSTEYANCSCSEVWLHEALKVLEEARK